MMIGKLKLKCSEMNCITASLSAMNLMTPLEIIPEHVIVQPTNTLSKT
jgi:hypothetical protein